MNKVLRSFREFSHCEREYLKLLRNGSPHIAKAPLYDHSAPEKQIVVTGGARFERYLEHTHDYVEMVYLHSGAVTHLVNGAEVSQRAGELLLFNQNVKHGRLPAREEDIMVLL